MLLNMEEIRNYVREHEVEELLELAILNFYEYKDRDPDRDLDYWTEKFDKEVFNETSQKSNYFLEHIGDIKRNIENYERVYEKLCDEKSKNTFLSLLNAKLFADNRYIEQVYEENEMYFDSELYDISKIQTYVDCGGYVGDSAIRFALNNPSYKKIYVFEPIKEVAQKADQNLRIQLSEGSYELFNKAVYDRMDKIGMCPEMLHGESYIDEGSTEHLVDATTLDIEVMEDTDLIKFDIEGSEKEALLGARGHIEKNRPILAVCVYHLKDDFWKIPDLVGEIRSDYKIYLRQYDPEVYSETVMYFIPPSAEKDHSVIQEKSVSKNKLLETFRMYTDDEYKNVLQHVKDKKWFLRQLRLKHERLKDNSAWLEEVEGVRKYQKQQLELKDERIKELEAWILELEKSKNYQEEQIELRAERIKQLEVWTRELENGKNWLETQYEATQKELEKIREQSLILEEEKIEKETKISKLEYKLNLVREDKMLSKILKLKKMEI